MLGTLIKKEITETILDLNLLDHDGILYHSVCI